MAKLTDQIELEEITPEQMIMDAAMRVLRAGIWLISNGYGRMMLLPYASGSGCYWRCEFHPLGRPLNPFYRYTSGSVTEYLADHCGGSIHANPSAKRLAQAIMKSVPEDAKAACEGPVSPETLEWLTRLEAVLDQDFLPEAFHEYTDDYSWWQLVSLTRGNGNPIKPQPGYIEPSKQLNVIDRDWSREEAAWNALTDEDEFLFGPDILADDKPTYELVRRLRRAFAEVDNDVDALRLMRAALSYLVL